MPQTRFLTIKAPILGISGVGASVLGVQVAGLLGSAGGDADSGVFFKLT